LGADTVIPPFSCNFSPFFPYISSINKGTVMNTKTHGSKQLMIIGLSVIVMLSAIDACAWRVGVSYRGGYHGSAHGGFRGGYNHYYPGFHHGYYYSGYGYGPRWPYGYDFAPGIGTFVTYLPDVYETVIINGHTYYFAGGYYFRPYSSGYVIVPEPVSVAPATVQTQKSEATAQTSSSSDADKQPVAQPKSASHDTITVNIPNSKGGFTPVALVKNKDGYLGPQGEFYAGHPTVDELKALYGN
jgi:hypothetical protein